MPRQVVPWVRLDDDFYDHPKVCALDDAAFRLWARMLGWCNRYLTGGDIPRSQLTDKQLKLASQIEKVGLWEPTDSGWHVHDFFDYQPTSEETKGRRSDLSEKRARAGRRGATKRWQTDGNDNGKPMANAMANEWQTDSPVPVPDPVVVTSSPPLTFVGDRPGRVEEALNLITARERILAGATIRNPEAWTRTVIERNRHDHGATLHGLAHANPGWTAEQLADVVAPPLPKTVERPLCPDCNRHTLGFVECPIDRPGCAFGVADEPVTPMSREQIRNKLRPVSIARSEAS